MAAAVDAHVTVAGFVVKQPYDPAARALAGGAAPGGAAAEPGGRREEGGARGLLRFSALSTPQAPAPKDQVSAGRGGGGRAGRHGQYGVLDRAAARPCAAAAAHALPRPNATPERGRHHSVRSPAAARLMRRSTPTSRPASSG